MNAGKVRLVHRFGGPEKVLEASWTGSVLFVHWPMAGSFRVQKSTGKLSQNGSWRVHPEDLERLLKPERLQAKKAMRKAMLHVGPPLEKKTGGVDR